MENSNIPSYFSPWKTQLLGWNKICSDLKVPPQHVALNFVVSNYLIDKVIIGVENLSQLVDLTSFRHCGLNSNLFNMCISSDEGLLNPSLWNLQG